MCAHSMSRRAALAYTPTVESLWKLVFADEYAFIGLDGKASVYGSLPSVGYQVAGHSVRNQILAIAEESCKKAVSLGEFWLRVEAFLQGAVWDRYPWGEGATLQFRGRDCTGEWSKGQLRGFVILPLSEEDI